MDIQNKLKDYMAQQMKILAAEDKEGTNHLTDEIKSYIINFIKDKKGAEINDDEIHSIADKFQVNVHELEGFIYTTLSKNMKENKKQSLDTLIENKVRQKLAYIKNRNQIIDNVSKATKIVKTKLITEAEEDLTDYAYKTYRYITDAMFITLKHPALKKEFYKSLTDLQNSIEKFLFDYNKNLDNV